MIISLAELLEREKIKREDTIYVNSNEEFLEYQVVAGDFYTWEKDTESIWFKNCVQLADFAYMEKMIPKLSCLNCPDRDKLPYFVSDLEDLKEAVSKGRQIGIEGGPCLFGAYEVMTEVVLEQGESVWFDYSTGNRVDAVKDYISMPALPYYRWGITDVLEMNSQDETDSYRTGKKAHKSRIKMSGILYPEFLSKNQKQTIFYAPLEYKEYIE